MPNMHDIKICSRGVSAPTESIDKTPVQIRVTDTINPKSAAPIFLTGQCATFPLVSAIAIMTPIRNIMISEHTKIVLHTILLRKNDSPFLLNSVSQIFAAPPIIPKIIVGIQRFFNFIVTLPFI